MSSRLLTMKFMQRAAASTSNPPSAPHPNSPSNPSAPPTKKQRLSNGSSLPSYTPDRRRETSQERIVRESIQAEEAKRDEALERLGREKGETRWVLSTVQSGQGEGEDGDGDGDGDGGVVGGRFRIVGLGEIDREDGDGEGVGRRTFGRPLPKMRGRAGEEEVGDEGGSSASGSGSDGGSGDSSEEDEPEDVDALIQRGRSEAAERARREMKEKKRERGREGSRMASERRGREVNLNSTPRRGGRGGGISSGGGSGGRGGRGGALVLYPMFAPTLRSMRTRPCRALLSVVAFVIGCVLFLNSSSHVRSHASNIWKPTSCLEKAPTGELKQDTAKHIDLDDLWSDEDEVAGKVDLEGSSGRHGATSRLATEDTSKDHDTNDFSLRPTTSSTLSTTDDHCSTAPDSSNIFITLKTGATELHAKLPAHLLTLSHCISPANLIIFSDAPDTFAGHTIHDALSNISSTHKTSHPDFTHYRHLHLARQLRLPPASLPRAGSRSWDLDKWKFLPQTFATYAAAPAHIEWFFFIEADTSVSWLNLLLWLATLDAKKARYIGAGRVVGDISFAHGGSGYILSRPAVEKLVRRREEEGVDKYDARWEAETTRHSMGDAILAVALKEAGVELEGGGSFLQSENLGGVELDEGKLCEPLVTMHHVDSALVSDLWALQGEWVGRYGWGEKMLRREVVERLMLGVMRGRRRGWENGAEKRRLVAEDVLMEEERGKDGLIDPAEWKGAELEATEDEDGCERACEEWDECKQWMWRPGRCYMDNQLKMGEIDIGVKDGKSDALRKDGQTWTSGWHQKRLRRMMQRVKKCK
ncbi:hypothetical protein BDZ85DRAFT_297997 [Elsinoe ampelina]|uniref:Glycosyltransferase family 31 protein n=1 Tax=Elsinoe ampelina TaxID=302913 RepID=A0A6A6G4Q5_9PEZI|nr:hypothetical protein BDZ85DRAFT_297997 [Elsinoe ampelina]